MFASYSTALGENSKGPLDLILESLYGFAYVMSKEMTVEYRAYLVFITIDALQFYNFPVNSSLWEGGDSAGIPPLATVLDVLSGDFVARSSLFTLYVVLLVASTLWTSLFVAASCYVAWCFITKAPQSGIVLKGLRSVATLTTTTLFLPFTTVMARALGCPGVEAPAESGSLDGFSWIGTGWQCDAAGPIIIRIFISAVLLVFAVLSVFITAVFIDRNPASASWSAKSHGRVDAVVLVIKVVLVLCFTVFRDVLLDSWVLTAILYLSGLTWAVLMFRQMPYVHAGVNGMQTGFAAVFVWSTVALTLHKYANYGDLSVLFYIGCGLSYCLGFLAVYAREHYIAMLPLEECSRVVHLDVWARHRMQDFAQSRMYSGGAVAVLSDRAYRRGNRGNDGGAGGGGTFLMQLGGQLMGLAESSTSGGLNGSHKRAASGSGGGSRTKHKGAGARDRSGAGRGDDTDASRSAGEQGLHESSDDEVEDEDERAVLLAQRRAAASAAPRLGLDTGAALIAGGEGLASSADLGGNIDADTLYGQRLLHKAYSNPRRRLEEQRLYAAERAYRHMVMHHAQNPMSHVLAAEFYRSFYPENNFAEAQCLSAARLRQPGLDVAFFIYQRTRALREGADSSKLSALDRVIFESLAKQAQESKIAAQRSILKLWEHLSQSHPRVGDLVGVSVEIEQSLARTEGLYKTMMQLNSGALVARNYAEFLLELRNDPMPAMELFNKADRIEERHTRQRQKAVKHVVLGAPAPDVDQLDDSAASLTVSASDSSLGEILSASPAACRLFGHSSTSYIVGLPVLSLLPEPVRTLWYRRVHSMVRLGFSPNLNRTEVTFVQQSNGAAIPVLLSLMESTPDEVTSSPRLTVSMDRLRCEENVIFFAGPRSGLRVLSASASSLSLMGVDADYLQRESYSIKHLLPSADRGSFDAEDWAPWAMLALLENSTGVRRHGRSGSPGRASRSMISMRGKGGKKARAQERRMRELDRRLAVELREYLESDEAHAGGDSLLMIAGGDQNAAAAMGGAGAAGGGKGGLVSLGSFIKQGRHDLSGAGSKKKRSKDGKGNARSAAGSFRAPHPPPAMSSSSSFSRKRSADDMHLSAVLEGDMRTMPVFPASMQLKSLLRQRDTGMIPVEGASDGTRLVFGSVQDLTPLFGERQFMLRWRRPGHEESRALLTAVRQALLDAGFGKRGGETQEGGSGGSRERLGAKAAGDVPTPTVNESKKSNILQLGSGGDSRSKVSVSVEVPQTVQLTTAADDDGSRSISGSSAGGTEQGTVGTTGGKEADSRGTRRRFSQLGGRMAQESHSRQPSSNATGSVGGMSVSQVDPKLGSREVSSSSYASMNSQTPMNSEKGLASKFAGRSASLMVAGSSTGSQNSTAANSQQGMSSARGIAAPGPLIAKGRRGSFARHGSAMNSMGKRRGSAISDGGAAFRYNAEDQGSVASSQSWMAQQLSKVVQTRAQAASEEVYAMQVTFSILLVIILILGVVGIVTQRVIGQELQRGSRYLYITSETAMEFQAFYNEYRFLGAHNSATFPPTLQDTEPTFQRIKARALRHYQLHLELTKATPALGARRAIDFVQEPIWPYSDSDLAGSAIGTTNVSALRIGDVLTGIMLTMAGGEESTSIIFESVPYRTLTVNADTYIEALNATLSYRQLDVVDSFDTARLLIGGIGIGCFVVAITVGCILFVRSLRGLRQRTIAVLDLLAHMPQRIAKNLKSRASVRLTNTVAKLEGLEDEDEDNQRDMGLVDEMDDKEMVRAAIEAGAESSDSGSSGEEEGGEDMRRVRRMAYFQRGNTMKRLLGGAPRSAAAATKLQDQEQERWKALISAENQRGGGGRLISGNSVSKDTMSLGKEALSMGKEEAMNSARSYGSEDEESNGTAASGGAAPRPSASQPLRGRRGSRVVPATATAGGVRESSQASQGTESSQVDYEGSLAGSDTGGGGNSKAADKAPGPFSIGGPAFKQPGSPASTRPLQMDAKADLARLELARGLGQSDGDLLKTGSDGRVKRAASSNRRKKRRQSIARALQKREFRDNWTFTLQSTIRFTVPLMLFFGWVLYLVIMVTTLLNQVMRYNERMVTLQRMAIDSVDYVRIAQNVGFLAPTNVTRARDQAIAEEIEGRMLQTLQKVTIGGEVVDEATGLTTTLGSLEHEYPKRLLFDEACFESPDLDGCLRAGESTLELQGLVFGFVDPRTRTFTRSMRNGATTAIYSLAQGLRQFIGGRHPDIYPGESPNFSPFTNPIYIQLLLLCTELAQPHLHDSLRRVAAFYANEVEDRIDYFMQINEAVIGSYLAVAFIAVVVLYWNAFQHLSAPLSASWQALSVVPPGVRDSLPGMRKGVRQLLTDVQVGNQARGDAGDD